MDKKLEAITQLADLSVKQANSTLVCVKAVESMIECVDLRVDLITTKVDTLGKIALDQAEQAKEHTQTIEYLRRKVSRVEGLVRKLSQTK